MGIIRFGWGAPIHNLGHQGVVAYLKKKDLQDRASAKTANYKPLIQFMELNLKSINEESVLYDNHNGPHHYLDIESVMRKEGPPLPDLNTATLDDALNWFKSRDVQKIFHRSNLVRILARKLKRPRKSFPPNALTESLKIHKDLVGFFRKFPFYCRVLPKQDVQKILNVKLAAYMHLLMDMNQPFHASQFYKYNFRIKLNKSCKDAHKCFETGQFIQSPENFKLLQSVLLEKLQPTPSHELKLPPEQVLADTLVKGFNLLPQLLKADDKASRQANNPYGYLTLLIKEWYPVAEQQLKRSVVLASQMLLRAYQEGGSPNLDPINRLSRVTVLDGHHHFASFTT